MTEHCPENAPESAPDDPVSGQDVALAGKDDSVEPSTQEPVAGAGDTVLLVAEDQRRVLLKLRRGGEWHTHRGIVRHDDILDQPLGRMVLTQLGHAFLVLEPSTHDLIRYIKRSTQIIFPKDAAFIVQRLNLYPGKRVIEAGTGSGGLTLALARAVMPTG